MHPSTSFHSTPNRHFHQASPSDTNNNSLPAASTQPLPTALPNRLSAMEERKTAIDTDRKPGAPSHCSLGPSRYPLAEAATPPSLKPCRIPMAPWQSSPSSCSGKVSRINSKCFQTIADTVLCFLIGVPLYH